MHYRFVRPAGPNKLEVLEFAWQHLYFFDYPNDLQFAPNDYAKIVIEPQRLTYNRVSDLAFESGKQRIEFVRSGNDLQMFRTRETLKSLGCEDITDTDRAFAHDTPAIAPSFNCDNAHNPRETAICGSEALSLLDVHLAAAFQTASLRTFLQPTTKAQRNAALKRLKAVQSDWWAHQLSPCQASDCVERLYTDRIRALEGIAHKP